MRTLRPTVKISVFSDNIRMEIDRVFMLHHGCFQLIECPNASACSLISQECQVCREIPKHTASDMGSGVKRECPLESEVGLSPCPSHFLAMVRTPGKFTQYPLLIQRLMINDNLRISSGLNICMQ